MSGTTKKICIVSAIAAAAGFLLALVAFLCGASVQVVISASGIEVVDRAVSLGRLAGNGVVPQQVQVIDRDVDAFEAVDIDVRLAHVESVAADAFGVELWSYQGNGAPQLDYEVKDNTLYVWESGNPRSNEGWSLQFGINFSGFTWSEELEPCRVIVYLPADAALQDVSVSTNWGDVDLGGFACEQLKVTTNYGGIALRDIETPVAMIEGNSADINLDGVAAADLQVENNFGSITLDATGAGRSGAVCIRASSSDVTLRGLRADELDIEDSFGNIDLSDVEVQRVLADLSSCDVKASTVGVDNADLRVSFGNVELSDWRSRQLLYEGSSTVVRIDGTLRGETTITNSFGDVAVDNALPRDECHLDLEASFGEIRVDDTLYGGEVRDTNSERSHTLAVDNSSGNITLRFAS